MGGFNYGEYSGDQKFYGALSTLKKDDPLPKEDPKEDFILEAAGDESMFDLADAQLRSMAMAVVLEWIGSGMYTFDDLAGYAEGVADLDGDEDLTEEEKAIYEMLFPEIGDAMASLGADDSNITEFLDNESDEAGAKLGGYLAGVLDNMPSSDDEIIASFATGKEGALFECAEFPEPEGEEDDGIYEATYKKVKVMRGGKLVTKKKRITGRVKLSSKQKAAMKKMRRKANSAAARLKRKKSMKARKKRGL